MLTGTIIYACIDSLVLLLMSLGFNMTFGISGVANFAYGALYILAAFLTWIFLNTLELPYLVSGLISIFIVTIIGALLYRVILLRVRGQELSEVITTFGIGMAILELFPFLGFVGLKYTLPPFIEESIEIFDTSVDIQRLIIVVISLLLITILWLFTHYTKIGLAFRAIAQDERTSLTFGIDSDKIAMYSVALGAGLAATAALFIMPLGNITISQGYDVLINALAICIIGGLGSMGGIVIASFVIGFIQIFTDCYIGSHWVMVVSLAAIFLVLIVKPSGFFGKQKELEERV
jgi:branched-chain amino acid transport system permease protein